MSSVNVHATALVLGGTGLLIMGPSGSGKSLLAFSLIEAARARRAFAALVSDDGVWLSVAQGRVVAEAPASIAGLIELRGFGPARIAHEKRAIVDRVVRLVEPHAAPRLRETVSEEIAGIRLPCLMLAARGTLASMAAVSAWLDAQDPQPT